jgi:ABC-type lipoprotein release transport system permease subunit
MRRLVEIAKTGLAALVLHPARTTATLCALLAMLVPYLTGIGLAQGIERDAHVSLRAGGDLYISGSQFGRPVPLSVTLVPQVRELEGVVDVVPRIVGRLTLGRDPVEVVLVGVPESGFPDSITCVDGRLPRSAALHEFVVGSELARRLNLKPGARLPPFYHNPRGEQVSLIVGLFQSDVAIWQSQLMFTTFETAGKVFAQEGLATDLVVQCRPGYADQVRHAIHRTIRLPSPVTAGAVQLNVTSRRDLEMLAAGVQSRRAGVFSLHFVVAFVIGILVLLVTSGFGLAERRREIGILKATGWQTDEVLLRSLVESLLLGVGGASFSVLLAYVWLRAFNGWGMAAILMPGVSAAPGFKVPFRLAPVPVLLAYVVASAVTLVGSIWSTWRAAITPPDEALR